ncbi:MAG: amidohydrolase family protein [Desulfobacteraceae bacterium]|nr:amidohydrolase family protein [Desulfobacteraceae bacterium]
MDSDVPPEIEAPIIHRAEWIVPITSPPVRDGGVLVKGDRILAFGDVAEIRYDCPAGTKVVEHGQAAIMPALVNAHTHLELSALKGVIPFPRTGFADWLEMMLPLRAALDREVLLEGFRKGLRESFESGTALCGDITNALTAFHRSEAILPERRVFVELLGFNLDFAAAADAAGIDPASATALFSLVPHSVYAASPQIISETREWTRERSLPYMVHAAEHPEEMEFLRSGKGYCRELLKRLGRWNPDWTPPGKTPVEYLNGLGALDSATILAHCVHMKDTDWAVAAWMKCSVVFCPRSNRNLGAGTPDIEKALHYSVRASLGTDSLASNTDLSLFAEAEFVLRKYPAAAPERVLEMITINPASALKRQTDFGSIEPGKRAALLCVVVEPGLNESHLAEALIRSGKRGTWKWLTPAQV